MKEVANPETIGWLVTLKWCGGILGTMAAIWILGKWAKRSSRRQGDKCRAEIVNDVLAAFHVDEGDGNEAAAALDRAIGSGKGALPSALSSIFRIECVYEPIEPGKESYQRKLMVYYRPTSASEKLLTIKREYAWAHLPSPVRAKFIREKGKRVIELLYTNEECM